MPSKPVKNLFWQMLKLCVLRMEDCSEKQPEGPFVVDNSGAAAVKRLVSHINGFGRNISMDNWFTSYGLQLIS